MKMNELFHSSVFFSNFAFAVIGLNRVGTKSAVNVNVMDGVFSFLVTLIEFLHLPKTRTHDFFYINCRIKKLLSLPFKMLSSSPNLPTLPHEPFIFLQGPRGPKGDIGPPGIQGPAGIKVRTRPYDRVTKENVN